MKSPIVKVVGMLCWLITALCAIHVGMQAAGYDVLMRLGLENNLMINLYAQYLCGVAGIVSLILYIMALTCKSCSCGEKNCHCGSGSSCGSTGGGYCSKCGSAPCRCGK